MSVLFYFPKPDYATSRMFIGAGHKVTANPHELYDVCVYTGGEDVSPFLYGEKALPTTHTSIKRDCEEIKQYRADGSDFPKVGICRGAQFLNVMHGGSLWQHVDGHTQSHDIIDEQTSEKLLVTSTHHQMMIPGDDCVVLAYGAQSTERRREGGVWKMKRDPKEDTEWVDPEVIAYPQYNTLCFQPHPEYPGHSDCTAYFFATLMDIVLPEVDKRRAQRERTKSRAIANREAPF